MTFRFAQVEDMLAYEEMLRHFLLEQEKAGSPVRLTRRTLNFYRDLAFGYVIGAEPGVVVFALHDTPAGPQPIGFTVAGQAAPDILDTTHGKIATVWITWVDPAHRRKDLGIGMLLYGEPRLVELGFETAAMTFREDNPEGRALGIAFGAVPIERYYHYRLGSPHGQRIEAEE